MIFERLTNIWFRNKRFTRSAAVLTRSLMLDSSHVFEWTMGRVIQRFCYILVDEFVPYHYEFGPGHWVTSIRYTQMIHKRTGSNWRAFFPDEKRVRRNLWDGMELSYVALEMTHQFILKSLARFKETRSSSFPHKSRATETSFPTLHSTASLVATATKSPQTWSLNKLRTTRREILMQDEPKRNLDAKIILPFCS